ncbi:stage V sporulation protein AD [Clostridia bacterium]|nr:stage V sporulation protein AD [Clostridia bacterium]
MNKDMDKNMKNMKSTIYFDRNPVISSFASVASKKEAEGSLANFFDHIEMDPYFKKETWEQAESEIQRIAVTKALEKANIQSNAVNFIFAGDLVNQCVCSTYALRDFNIPFLGIYGACSTMAEGMLLAASMVNAGYGERATAVTSSHFSSAERQYRNPLSYGGQRTQSAQWTVTGGGAVIIEQNTEQSQEQLEQKTEKKIIVKSATVGRIVDYAVTDSSNMGAAMAPAAADTILRFFKDTNMKVTDLDYIVTGDLGYVGSELLLNILRQDDMDISFQHRDCGVMIYKKDEQDTHSGGSGCGCSASVLSAYFLPRIKSGEIKNMLFCGTGALMSPMLSFQGESIPGIAHAVLLSQQVDSVKLMLRGASAGVFAR